MEWGLDVLRVISMVLDFGELNLTSQSCLCQIEDYQPQKQDGQRSNTGSIVGKKIYR
jgi:hypothetical protein